MADRGRVDELKRKFEQNPKRYFVPLANEYRSVGEPGLAIDLCRIYLPQQPTHMSGYIVYGQALRDTGHTEEAAAVFRQALTLDPENIIALRQLGDISRGAGDEIGARGWYDKLLELDPRNEEMAAYNTAAAHPGSPAVVTVADDGPESTAADATGGQQAPTTAEPFDVLQWPTAPDLDATESPEASAAATTVPDFSLVLERPVRQPAAQRAAQAVAQADAQAATQADASPATPRDQDSPFVTETMAELYMQQGLRGEALGIYRQLALKRDDPVLRQRIGELESGRSSDGAGETVRAFFARIGARRPSGSIKLANGDIAKSGSGLSEELRADRHSSLAVLSALFDSVLPNAHDVSAAKRLFDAFGNPRLVHSHS